MKTKYFFKILLITLLFSVNGCKDNPQELSCRLYVYGGFGKIYQIYFNGKDSIETKCGRMSVDNYDLLRYNPPLPQRKNVFDTVFVKKKCRLSQKLAAEIRASMKRLNSKIVTDTLEKGVKDVWYYGLYLPKQTISLELVKNKDEDVNSLLTKLIDNSPYYINMEDRYWDGQEYEDYLINKYGKRKLSLSSWD